RHRAGARRRPADPHRGRAHRAAGLRHRGDDHGPAVRADAPARDRRGRLDPRPDPDGAGRPSRRAARRPPGQRDACRGAGLTARVWHDRRMRQRVLVTGGAGFIGSHTVVELAAEHDVSIVDNFSNAVPAVMGRLKELTGRPISVHNVDLRDHQALRGVFADGGFDAVIHFAGLKAVGDSVGKPLEYYDNNVAGTLSLLRAMQEHRLRRLVFSSSATVYGAKASVPMTEDLPTSATNPYGWTKVMIEQILRDLAATDP